jgi:hypothetical protein
MTAQADSEVELENTQRRERQAMFWVYAAIGADVAGLLWLGVRADSPPWMRALLDILIQTAVGGAILASAFRFLLLYPFRIYDLLAIVIVMSLSARVVLDQIGKLSFLGLIHARPDMESAGELALALTIVGSILLAGAAIGLRTCHRLKVERPFSRIVALAASMLALPASAAAIALSILLALAVVKPGAAAIRVPMVLGLWFASLAITFINIRNYGRMLTLGEEITAQEKLPK